MSYIRSRYFHPQEEQKEINMRLEFTRCQICYVPMNKKKEKTLWCSYENCPETNKHSPSREELYRLGVLKKDISSWIS